MKNTLNLDFSLNRVERAGRRRLISVALALICGLLVGGNVWRWQTLQSEVTDWTELIKSQQTAKSVNTMAASLTAEQVKLATHVQGMLDSLLVPWDVLLQAIEKARPKNILVEAIKPNAQDGKISITVNSPNFQGLAVFIEALMEQNSLYDVMLVSESLPDESNKTMRAVISAGWRQTK